MTAPAKVNSLGKEIPRKLFLHPGLMGCRMTGNTGRRMIISSRNFIFMAFQTVRELLGIRSSEIKEDNGETKKEKNKKDTLNSGGFDLKKL